MALCLSVLLTACGGTEEKGQTDNKTVQTSASAQNEDSKPANMNEAGVFPIVKDKVTLSVLTNQNGLIVNMETNEMTKYMEEKTNVHIDWQISANLAETKSIFLASGDYPDVIFNGDITQEEQMIYGPKGVFIPLNELIEKYGVETKNMFNQLSFVKPEITNPDGNIYALPMVSETYHMMFRYKMWINTEWLKNLNLKMPETTEEFYQVLKAFKEKDPNGNKKQDEIPLSGITNRFNEMPTYFSPVTYLMSAFITDDGNNRWVQPFNGKLDTILNKPEFKEGLKYLNKLYKEGLLDTEVFTQDPSVLKQKGENAGTPLLGAVSSHGPHVFTNMDGETFKKYDAIPPLKGPAGVQTTAFVPERVYQGCYVITNKCKEPEAAFRWADWLYSEEATQWTINGREGKEWRKAEAGETGINGKPAKWAIITKINELQNVNWAQMGPSVRTAEWRLSQAAPTDIYSNAGFEARLYQASKLYDPYHTEDIFPVNIFLPLENAAEVAQLRDALNKFVDESTARFITGDLDIESGWDGYIKSLNDIGLNRFIELNQKAYEMVYKK